ncbi:MAG: hypothetical protein KTR33_14875 [Gammaproteobacteria bacterium]|nr:hypothetical protein [Gammaproteobacteria bacterium]
MTSLPPGLLNRLPAADQALINQSNTAPRPDFSQYEAADRALLARANSVSTPVPEPEQNHRYVLTTRSFAPPESFGGGFQGDNRGYTTDPDVTSRITSTIAVDTDDQVNITADDVSAHSDPSIWHPVPFYAPTETPTVEILHQDVEHQEDVSIISVKTKHAGEDAVPAVTLPGWSPVAPGQQFNPSPSLDVYTDLRLVDNRQLNTLSISGQITGDNFPATEVFITDNSGQSLFLATGRPPAIASPIFNLPNYGMGPRHVADVAVVVNTDEQGNFVSVQLGNEEIPIDEWNETFEQRDAGFIDPLEPLNAAALELRESYQEIGREWDEAGREISDANGVLDTSGEILEAGGELLWETGEGLVEITGTAVTSTGETAVAIGEVGLEKLDDVTPDWVKPWKW